MNNLCTLRLTGCRLTRLRLLRDKLEAEMLSLDALPLDWEDRSNYPTLPMPKMFELISTFRGNFCDRLIDVCVRIDPECNQDIRPRIVRRYAHVVYLIAKLEAKHVKSVPPGWMITIGVMRKFGKSPFELYQRFPV